METLDNQEAGDGMGAVCAGAGMRSYCKTLLRQPVPAPGKRPSFLQLPPITLNNPFIPLE